MSLAEGRDALKELREILATRFNLYRYEGVASDALNCIEAALQEPEPEPERHTKPKKPAEPTA